jgi:hypothetical protein
MSNTEEEPSAPVSRLLQKYIIIYSMYACNSGENSYNIKLFWIVKKNLKIFVISSHVTSIHCNALPLRQLTNNCSLKSQSSGM